MCGEKTNKQQSLEAIPEEAQASTSPPQSPVLTAQPWKSLSEVPLLCNRQAHEGAQV